jgi:hypothetical protein
MMSSADPTKTAAVAATPIYAANVVIGTAIGVKAVATRAAAYEMHCSKYG